MGIAFAGHVPASGVWLVSFYSFVYHATPDSLLLVNFLVLFLQLALFAGCVVLGGWLLLRRDRGLGLGILIGWVVGIIGLVLGTVLIFITAPSDPQAAAPSARYSHSTKASAGG